MPAIAIPERNAPSDTASSRPAISVLLSLEQKSFSKEQARQSVKKAANRVEQQLLERYPGETVLLMMSKLRQLTGAINYDSNKKSVAIYLSPLMEKILYLNIPVNDTVTVDQSFEIKDIILNKKQSRSYLVLHLTENEYRIYEGKEKSLHLILHNSAGAHYAGYKALPDKISTHNDIANELMRRSFPDHAASTLRILLQAYHLPVFVAGQKQAVDNFRTSTGDLPEIVDFLYTAPEQHGIQAIEFILSPYLSDWKRVSNAIIKNQLKKAADQQKLTGGIAAVWQDAAAHKGRMLVVEKNFKQPAVIQNGAGRSIAAAVKSYAPFSYIANMIDEIIEKVLESGGDVAFVEDGQLASYGHIALIR